MMKAGTINGLIFWFGGLGFDFYLFMMKAGFRVWGLGFRFHLFMMKAGTINGLIFLNPSKVNLAPSRCSCSLVFRA